MGRERDEKREEEAGREEMKRRWEVGGKGKEVGGREGGREVGRSGY